MTEDRKRALERVRKLLAIDGTNATEGEVSNAMDAAARLMDAHHIEQAEAEGHHTDAAGCAPWDVPGSRLEARHIGPMAQVTAYTGGANCAAWECTLAYAVSALVGTVQWYQSGKEQKKSPGGMPLFREGKPIKATRVIFYGPEEDGRLAAHLFAEMLLTIATMATTRHGGVYRGPGRSYAEGFARSLERRAAEAAKERRGKVLMLPASNAPDNEIDERPGSPTYGEPTTTALATRTLDQHLLRIRRKGSAWLKNEAGVRLRTTGGGGGQHHPDANAQGRRDGSRTGFSATRTPKLPAR